jgi:non-heme chloroperoxidase
MKVLWILVLCFPVHCLTNTLSAQTQASHSSAHIQFVTVDRNVKLEVLDWGGSGRPVVLLAGLGMTAHAFDNFAPKLTSNYHVYGITRRGFGNSSIPKPDGNNYFADRLGDDVLAVLDALKLDKPVLAGHSMAGEELSSIGTRHPERVAGLVYLDAAYGYAYFNDKSARGDPTSDAADVRSDLDRLFSLVSLDERVRLAHHLLETSIPRLERDIQEGLKLSQGTPNTAPPDSPTMQASLAIRKGVQIYSAAKCPVLAIYAVPHSIPESMEKDPARRAQIIADDLETTSAQVDAFQTGNPSARVVRIPNANHLVYRSNEADVVREMNAFIATLP